MPDSTNLRITYLKEELILLRKDEERFRRILFIGSVEQVQRAQMDLLRVGNRIASDLQEIHNLERQQ
jgi:hypothetical protein